MGLTQDGKYGDQTHAALMDALADDEDPQEPAEPEVPEENDAPEVAPETPKPAMIVITANSGKVNIRAGNGTNYSRITSVVAGTELKFVAQAVNGWYAVEIGSRIGWVSNEFSHMVA